MSAARTLRALPTVFRVGLAEAMAYRAELLVWILTTTMPLVMLPLWQAVAETGPVRGYDAGRFTAYFLAAFVVRQLTAVWAAWSINQDIRTGALGLRLLRPIPPFVTYAVESLSAMPLRLLVALPLALAALALTDGRWIADDWRAWLLVLPALAGAWLISFAANLAIGGVGLWSAQSIKLMDAWLAGYFVLSGYLVPIAVFPDALRAIPDYAPFRYVLSFPVELLTRGLSFEEALPALAAQWAWALGLLALAAAIWSRGLVRHATVGG